MLPDLANRGSFFLNCRAAIIPGMKTPQQLSREAIDEFKAIYKAVFGRALSDEEVQEMAMRLLRFFGILSDSGQNQNPDSPQADH